MVDLNVYRVKQAFGPTKGGKLNGSGDTRLLLLVTVGSRKDSKLFSPSSLQVQTRIQYQVPDLATTVAVRQSVTHAFPAHTSPLLVFPAPPKEIIPS